VKDKILIAIVAAIALVAYILIPEFARLAVEWSRRRYRKVLRSKASLDGTCEAFRDGKLTVKTDNEKAIELLPRKTRFFSLHDGIAEFVPWRTIATIDRGIGVSVILPEKWRWYAVCVFRNGATEIAEADVLMPTPGGIKHVSVAIGAFLEFLALLYSLGYAEGSAIAAQLGHTIDFGPSAASVSILALVAIFGKALPYCPPGLFLTLAAHGLTHDKRGHKKNRRRMAGGFLLFATGIALNVAVIFFVISRVGFRLP
jgi:hypothetical protein